MKIINTRYNLVISLMVLFSFVPITFAANPYWVSPTGTATWTNCQSPTPLSGTASCPYSTAATNAVAGDTVYFRTGTYALDSLAPSHSGSNGNLITFSAYSTETVTLTQQRVANYDMELDSNWSSVGSPTTNARSTEQVLQGTYSRKIVVNAAGQGIQSDNFNIPTSGKGYYYEVWIYPSVTSVRILIEHGDGSGSWLDSTVTGLTANKWQLIQSSGSQLAGSRAGSSGYIRILSPAGVSSATYYVDNVRVEAEAPAVNLTGINYIKLNGLTFTNLNRGLVLWGASHNEISNCSFTNYSADYYVMNEISDGNSYNVSTPSTYNWIHDSTFGDMWANVSGCWNPGDVFRIGNDYNASSSADPSRYNLIENCVVYHGGHSAMLISTKYNTIRNNYFRNDGYIVNHWNCNRNPVMIGSRVMLFETPYIDQGGYNLIEGNRIAYGHQDIYNSSTSDGSGIENPTTYNIFRYNYIFANGVAGYESKVQQTSGGAGYTNGSNNYIYNNTIWYNGYGEANVAGYNYGILLECSQGYYPSGIIVKNNINYNNHDGATGYYGYANCWSQQTYTNNLETDPSFINTDISDPTSQTLPNLTFGSGSTAIDRGTYLTTVAAGDSGSGTSLIVNDASYFQDGTWSPSGKTNSDWIAVSNVSNYVQISSINYSTNTIALANSISRKAGDSVWLYKDSSGKGVLYGPAPDLGAYEYEDTQSLSPPKNLRVVPQ